MVELPAGRERVERDTTATGERGRCLYGRDPDDCPACREAAAIAAERSPVAVVSQTTDETTATGEKCGHDTTLACSGDGNGGDVWTRCFDCGADLPPAAAVGTADPTTATGEAVAVGPWATGANPLYRAPATGGVRERAVAAVAASVEANRSHSARVIAEVIVSRLAAEGFITPPAADVSATGQPVVSLRELVDRLSDHASGNVGAGCWELHDHYADILAASPGAESASVDNAGRQR